MLSALSVKIGSLNAEDTEGIQIFRYEARKRTQVDACNLSTNSIFTQRVVASCQNSPYLYRQCLQCTVIINKGILLLLLLLRSKPIIGHPICSTFIYIQKILLLNTGCAEFLQSKLINGYASSTETLENDLFIHITVLSEFGYIVKFRKFIIGSHRMKIIYEPEHSQNKWIYQQKYLTNHQDIV